MVRCKFVQKSLETERCESKGISRSRRSRFDVLRSGKGSGSCASLKLGLELAVPPGGEDEVDPGEDVSGQHHADDDLQQEGEFFEGLNVSSGEEGGDRGGCGGGSEGFLWHFRPLVEVIFDLSASGIGGGESIANDTGLLLSLWLGGALELALVEAALETNGECIGDRLGDANGFVNSDVTEGHISDIRGNAEESLGNGSNTWIFMVEAGHKGSLFASEVRLVVEGVLGVDEPLAGVESILDESSTVFENEAGLNGTSAQHV